MMRRRRRGEEVGPGGYSYLPSSLSSVKPASLFDGYRKRRRLLVLDRSWVESDLIQSIPHGQDPRREVT